MNNWVFYCLLLICKIWFFIEIEKCIMNKIKNEKDFWSLNFSKKIGEKFEKDEKFYLCIEWKDKWI